MTLPTMTPSIDEMWGLLAEAQGTGPFAIAGMERPLPWEVWTSNSFRRVKTARGIDVLSGYQCRDGCVDLSMPEDRLVALVAAVNAAPTLLSHLASLEAENTALRSAVQPFADKADKWEAKDPGRVTAPHSTVISHRIGDFRFARSTLNNRSNPNG